MTPEEKELLKRTLKLSEDNNRILVGLQRSVKWHSIWSLTKILFIVVPLVIGYFFIQPYLDSVGASMKDLPENIRGMQELYNSVNKF